MVLYTYRYLCFGRIRPSMGVQTFPGVEESSKLMVVGLQYSETGDVYSTKLKNLTVPIIIHDLRCLKGSSWSWNQPFKLTKLVRRK